MAHSHVISLLQRIFPRASVSLLPPDSLGPSYLVSYSDRDGSGEWIIHPGHRWRAVPQSLADPMGDIIFRWANVGDGFGPAFGEFEASTGSSTPSGYPAEPGISWDLNHALFLHEGASLDRVTVRWRRRDETFRRLEDLTGPEPGRWSIYKTTFTWTLTAMALELEYDVEFKQLRRTQVNIGGSVYPVGAPLEEALADLRKLRDMALLIERTLNPAED